MSITRLPQGSSQYTHKSLLLWHRRDKIDQLQAPLPKDSPHSSPPPTPVTRQDSLLLGNSPLIVSPLTWPPGLALGTPALPPPHKQSALAFCCCRDGGWVHAGHTCMGEHAQCRGAPTCGMRLCSLSPTTTSPSLRVKSRKKGCYKKKSLYVTHTCPGHTLWWPRNTTHVYKTDDKWILLHTGTVVTTPEVFKNRPDSFLSGWKH